MRRASSANACGSFQSNPARTAARATARYMAPVFRKRKPRRRAKRTGDRAFSGAGGSIEGDDHLDGGPLSVVSGQWSLAICMR